LDQIKLISIADTDADRERGLMFVRHLPEDAGMLFRLANPRILSFWMRNTYLDLDIAFVNQDGRIVKTERMIPLSSRGVSSGAPCVMALEVPAGSLERAGAVVGKRLLIDEQEMTVKFDD
jgi:hypothetical protein